MPPNRPTNDGILGHKRGGNWRPPALQVGPKRAWRVVGGVQEPAQYLTRRAARANIIKYHRNGRYLIPRAPFCCLCYEIVSDLALQQLFCWPRSAVQCLHVLGKKFMVITRTNKLSFSPSIITSLSNSLFITGARGAAHAGCVTHMVQELRLGENAMKVLDGQPDGPTQAEMRRHVNQDGGAPGDAPHLHLLLLSVLLLFLLPGVRYFLHSLFPGMSFFLFHLLPGLHLVPVVLLVQWVVILLGALSHLLILGVYLLGVVPSWPPGSFFP